MSKERYTDEKKYIEIYDNKRNTFEKLCRYKKKSYIEKILLYIKVFFKSFFEK